MIRAGFALLFATALQAAQISAISQQGAAAQTVLIRVQRLDGVADAIERSVPTAAVTDIPLPPGFAPEFRFGMTITPDKRQSSLHLHFVAGASLSGRVAAVRGALTSIEGTDVALFPAIGMNATSKQTVRSDAKGFFQFKGLTA